MLYVNLQVCLYICLSVCQTYPLTFTQLLPTTTIRIAPHHHDTYYDTRTIHSIVHTLKIPFVSLTSILCLTPAHTSILTLTLPLTHNSSHLSPLYSCWRMTFRLSRAELMTSWHRCGDSVKPTTSRATRLKTGAESLWQSEFSRCKE